MFVRPRRSDSGETYHTHRLVRSERVGGKVRQRTLLNLGRHFDIEPGIRVGEALSGQAALLADCPPAVEREAQRIAAQLIARGTRRRATFRRGFPELGADRPVGARAAGADQPRCARRRWAPSSGAWRSPPRSGRRCAGCASASACCWMSTRPWGRSCIVMAHRRPSSRTCSRAMGLFDLHPTVTP